jgi:hypothetical protein
MPQQASVISYISLSANSIRLNGEVLFEQQGVPAPAFLQAAYAHFGVNYPKFFKMDNLCKTGFIAAELLLQNQPFFAALKPEERSIVIQNANSSLDTDIRYEESIATAPSPSLFVYTLPNVLIGELCIRHQVKGETACFVFDIFDAGFQEQYVSLLPAYSAAKSCIAGWVDYYNGKAEAFLCLVQYTGTGLAEHTAANLEQLIKQ